MSESLQFKNTVDRFSDLLRSCAGCSSGWGYTDYYCESCWVKFLRAKTHAHLWINILPEIEIRSLLKWDHGDRETARLIYSLKGGALPRVWDRLTQNLIHRSLRDENFSRRLRELSHRWVIVPAPSATKERPDHAFVFAATLNRELGFPIMDVLERTPHKNKKRVHQRELSRIERLMRPQVRLESSLLQSGGWMEREAPKKAYIFVDDVVTTGATVRSAFRALGCPKKFMVFSLACRTRAPLI